MLFASFMALLRILPHYYSYNIVFMLMFLIALFDEKPFFRKI